MFKNNIFKSNKLDLLQFLIVSVGSLVTTTTIAQNVALTCVSSENPDFRFNLAFDSNTKMLYTADKVYKDAVTNDSISFITVVGDDTFKTIIYRDTGRFVVKVTGSTSFSFGGVCGKRVPNRF